MSDNSNAWRFERGLAKDFMEKLELVAAQPGWFADVLADCDLILGIRKNYLNVYRQGQSLFKIEWNGKTGSLKFSTHPKYLVDPDLSKAVMFDGSVFQVGGHKALLETYSGRQDLVRMKRAAKLYRGDEKDGLHAVVRANPNVIDTEIAFSCEAEGEEQPFAPRIDLACFEEVKGEIRLRFWEAKLYSNPEIRAAGDTEPPVVVQVRGYRQLIEKHRKQIVESYHVVARNLVYMSRWAGPQRKVDELVERVAGGEPTVIDESPFVGLIIYGYDSSQKGSDRWNRDIEKLKREKLMVVRSAGDPKNIKLRGGDPVGV